MFLTFQASKQSKKWNMGLGDCWDKFGMTGIKLSEGRETLRVRERNWKKL